MEPALVSACLLGDAVRDNARARGIRTGVLKEGSPSCSSPSQGVTATPLYQTGVHVFSETRLAEADALRKKAGPAIVPDRDGAC